MRFLLHLGLLAALTWVQPTAAQPVGRVPAGNTASGKEALSFNQTQGFARADVVMAQGEKHVMFVELSARGFGEAVPFFRQEEDIANGTQPLYLSVDNVKSIYVPSTGLYLEHVVVKGRDQRILAAQVLQGAVDLFSYAPVQLATNGPAGFQAAPTVYSRQQWFVRRPGQLLEEVGRSGFAKRMANYLQDDPVLVETLMDKKLGFDDMRLLVRLYNEHRAAPVRAK